MATPVQIMKPDKKSNTANSAEPVGYKVPPKSTQFQKGKSGNPRGRPKGRHRDIPYDDVLGQIVTIREGEKERRVTAAEAFILQLTRKGLTGDSSAAQASLQAIEAARARRPANGAPIRYQVLLMGMGPGPVLETLGIATRRTLIKDERVEWHLSPWIVEMALARLRGKTFNEDEQREIWNATRTPAKVNWPEWWVVRS